MLTSEDIADLSIKGEEIIGDIYDDSVQFKQVEKSRPFVIAGIVSTTDRDLEGEALTEEALESIWNSIKDTPEEFRGLYIGHDSTCIGKMLMEYKNRKSALLDRNKLYLIFELRDDIPDAINAKKLIESGKINNFSIKFGIEKPKENTEVMCDEKRCTLKITGSTYFLETSITDSAANPHAGPITILSS